MDISGNKATAYGLIAAAEKAGLRLFLGSYPITPATDILHELSKHKSLGVTTVQCEDEFQVALRLSVPRLQVRWQLLLLRDRVFV